MVMHETQTYLLKVFALAGLSVHRFVLPLAPSQALLRAYWIPALEADQPQGSAGRIRLLCLSRRSFRRPTNIKFCFLVLSFEQQLHLLNHSIIGLAEPG